MRFQRWTWAAVEARRGEWRRSEDVVRNGGADGAATTAAGDGARTARRAGGSVSDAQGKQRAESVRHPRNRPPVGGEPRLSVHFLYFVVEI